MDAYKDLVEVLYIEMCRANALKRRKAALFLKSIDAKRPNGVKGAAKSNQRVIFVKRAR